MIEDLKEPELEAVEYLTIRCFEILRLCSSVTQQYYNQGGKGFLQISVVTGYVFRLRLSHFTLRLKNVETFRKTENDFEYLLIFQLPYLSV